MCHNLERNKEETKLRGAPNTLKGHLRYPICAKPQTVTPAVLQLPLVGLSVACKEGIVETYQIWLRYGVRIENKVLNVHQKRTVKLQKLWTNLSVIICNLLILTMFDLDRINQTFLLVLQTQNRT